MSLEETWFKLGAAIHLKISQNSRVIHKPGRQRNPVLPRERWIFPRALKCLHCLITLLSDDHLSEA